MLDRWLAIHHPDPGRRDRLHAGISRSRLFSYCRRLDKVDVFFDHATSVLSLPNERGLIVGSLFPRHRPARRITADDVQDLESIAAGGLPTLATRYWGAYIVILVDGEEFVVARDPIGCMPCYFLDDPSHFIASSDAPSFVDAGLIEPAIAWSEIPRYLSAKDLPCSATAIHGIVELPSGTAVGGCRAPRIPVSFWSPWNHVDADPDWSRSAASVTLRRRVESAVECWMSCRKAPLLLVSGGLDSSIVAVAMQRASASFTCLTMVTEDPGGDERDFARVIAAHVGARLEERHYDLNDVDLDRSVCAHLPKPIGLSHELALYSAIARESERRGVDAIVTGNGGDNVFYNSSSIRPLIDHFIAGGSKTALVATARDVAAATGTTLWEVVQASIRFWSHRRSPYVWARDLDFLNPELAAELAPEPIKHPWLDGPDNALPGKRGHIAMLLRMQNHIEGYLRGAGFPIFDPLVAQPVVESCLAVPTWWTVDDGRDRAVARAAFASALPKAILDRQSKGSPAGFALSLLDRKSEEIKQRLLGGQLASRGFLDRGAIERALRRGSAIGRGDRKLLNLLDMEAWIAAWQHRPTPGHGLPPLLP